MKRLSMLLMLLSLFGGVAAHARPKILRIIGTVEQVGEANLTVKTNQGRVHIVTINSETMFMRGDIPSPSRNLKVGEKVILRVFKRRKHLIAAEITIETTRISSSNPYVYPSKALTAELAKATSFVSSREPHASRRLTLQLSSRRNIRRHPGHAPVSLDA